MLNDSQYIASLTRIIRDEPERAWQGMIDRARELKGNALFVELVERWNAKEEEQRQGEESRIEIMFMVIGCHPIRAVPTDGRATAAHYRAVIRDILLTEGGNGNATGD